MEDFLELRRIHKSFVGVYALRGVDFSIRKGEIHCLVGENGSGKWIVFVVDADDILLELDETNNVVIFGPLP